MNIMLANNRFVVANFGSGAHMDMRVTYPKVCCLPVLLVLGVGEGRQHVGQRCEG